MQRNACNVGLYATDARKKMRNKCNKRKKSTQQDAADVEASTHQLRYVRYVSCVAYVAWKPLFTVVYV